MSDAINLAKLQDAANQERKQREDLKIVKEVSEKMQAILNEFGCALVPVLTVAGGQFQHVVNVVVKPKDSGIVDNAGNKIVK